MADDVTSGTVPNAGSAQPAGGTTNTQSTQAPSTNDPKITADLEAGKKAQAELKELQDYFSQRKELYDAALRYDQDPKFQEHIKSYLAGNGNGKEEPSPTEKKPDLSFLTEEQRAAVDQIIETKVRSIVTPLNNEVSQLRTYSAQSQINELRSKYTPEKGYTVSFKDKEAEIATMLRQEQASSPEAAYLQIVGSMLPQIVGEYNKKIVDTKRQISMSRSTAPTTHVMRKDGDKPMTFLEAVRIAQEKVGI